MAKNKVYIDIVVDDKGTTKRVAVNAKKLGSALEGAGKSARTADRNLKGAAQTSANATKNFSKMAQGLSGGLVPAYATLAAQVFAITAAFNFLKSAADFSVLATGQVAYAKSTGIAIKSLTEDIIQATNAQISFSDAAQASAIGLAAGLSTDQLERLGTAARDTSAILGRDVTDSFNRLVRGVTKAEPELLDELGIILRLETASRKYADAIGKDVKELTQFEKSQAVANDVLEQAESKYSSVLTEQEKLGNSVAKLGVAFENNLLKPFKEGLAKVLGPVFDFFTENVAALAVALGLLAVPILKAIIPGLNDMGDAAKAAAAQAKDAANASTFAFKRQVVQLRKVVKAQQDIRTEAAKNAKDAVQNLSARKGSGLESLQSGGVPSQRQAKGMIRAIEGNAKAYRTLTDKQRATLAANIKLMVADTEKGTKRMLLSFKTLGAGAKTVFVGMRAAYAGAMAGMRALTTGFVTFANKALAAIGWIGIIMLVIDLMKIAISKLREFFETAEQRNLRLLEEKELEKMDRLKSKLSGVNEELAEMATTTMKAGAAGGAFAGNVLSNVNVQSLKTALTSSNEELKEEAQKTAQYYFEIFKDSEGALGQIGTELASQAGKIGKGIDQFMTEDQIEKLLQYITRAQEAGLAASKFTSALKNQQEIEISFMGGLQQTTKYDGLIKSLSATIRASKDVVVLQEKEKKEIERSVALRDLLINMRDREFKAIRAKTALEMKYNDALLKATPLQAARLQQQQKIDGIQLTINDKLREQQNLNNLIAQQENGATAAQLNTLTLLGDELDLLGQKKGILEEQLTMLHEMEMAAKGAFESGVTGGLTDLITGKESSFKDAVANIAKTTLEAIAQTLSKNIAEKLSTAIFGDSASNRIKGAHVEGAEVVKQKIKEGHIEGMAAATETAGTTTATDVISGGGSTTSGKTAEGTQSIGIMEKLFGKSSSSTTSTMGQGEKMGETVTKQKVGGSVTNFLGSLSDIFDKNAEGGFVEKLGNVFEAGSGIFKDIFSSLPDLLGGLFGGAGGGIGGGIASFITSFFANGGIAKGGFRSAAYARGGVATQPTVGLVGEGRYNEAIVPLPDGKSIPVAMNGMGQQNNVTVNVSMDGNGNVSQEEQGGQGMDLGRVIAAAVQQELLNQKRSGGILSPYGAS